MLPQLCIQTSFVRVCTWRLAFYPRKTWLKTLCTQTLKAADWKKGPRAEISFLFADNETSQHYNKRHLGRDRPTNVLAFPTHDASYAHGSILLGDVLLAYQTIADEAVDQKKPFEAHLTHLIVHGVLHLLGFDHTTPQEATRMEGLEIAILKKRHILNPYHIL